jgi:hypothetical protein
MKDARGRSPQSLTVARGVDLLASEGWALRFGFACLEPGYGPGGGALDLIVLTYTCQCSDVRRLDCRRGHRAPPRRFVGGERAPGGGARSLSGSDLAGWARRRGCGSARCWGWNTGHGASIRTQVCSTWSSSSGTSGPCTGVLPRASEGRFGRGRGPGRSRCAGRGGACPAVSTGGGHAARYQRGNAGSR